MKFFIYAALPILLPLGLYLFDPQPFQFLKNNIGLWSDRIWYQKRVTFEGLKVLRPDDVAPLLPSSSSNLWWLLNADEIESKLRTQPLIEKAVIRNCNRLMLGCYVIAIQERVPALVLKHSSGNWLVGREGGFLSALSPASAEAKTKGADALTEVTGSGIDQFSPDQVKVVLSQVVILIDLLRDRGQLVPLGVDVKSAGDVTVRFQSDMPVANFSLVTEPGLSLKASFGAQIDRLQRILRELGTRRVNVLSVDLAFDKLAVVKFEKAEGADDNAAKR